SSSGPPDWLPVVCIIHLIRLSSFWGPPHMADSPSNSNVPNDSPGHWTVIRCGLAGVCVMAVICFIKFLAAIPRLLTDDWTWTEMALFPLQMMILGFFPGIVTGLLLPLRRFGHAIIGAGCANVYLLACFALFELDGLLNARLATVLAFVTITSISGGAMGGVIANDIQKANRQTSTPDQKADG
ncbi:MAG: hypothetical protein JXM70_30320, partial [Pirellulales bacterium]|nr:hypothetical protein [Pirellulales bacterium]